MMGVTLTLPFSLEIIERSVFMFKFEQRENDVADNNSNLQAIMTGIRKIEIQPCLCRSVELTISLCICST